MVVFATRQETTDGLVMSHVQAPFRVFWQPGCSSCVKVKEFLGKLGVPFESVNILTDAQGLSDLQKLGPRSVPVVSQGARYTFAQSLSEVAAFVGKTLNVDRLAPEKLVERWLLILGRAERHAAQIPAQHFTDDAVAGRPRSIGDLAYHIFEIPLAFLQTVEHGQENWLSFIANHAPPTVTTPEAVAAYGAGATAALARWWQTQSPKPVEALLQSPQRIECFSGPTAMWEFLERCTWHSAQHTRQLIMILDRLGVAPDRPLAASDYAGLPMPEGLWT